MKPAKEGDLLTVYVKGFPKPIWNKFTGYARIIDLSIQEALQQALQDWCEAHKKEAGL